MLKQFEDFWEKIGETEPMLDSALQIFDVWQDEYGVSFCGTRHRETGQEHGIVRSCESCMVG